MVAAFVLVAGVVLLMLIGVVILTVMGNAQLLASLVPLAPALVMCGTFLLILTELLLLFGNKDDRRDVRRDMGYLIPTFFVSMLLYYVTNSLLS